MLLEIGLIIGGIPAGFVFRSQEKVKKVINRSLTWAVWMLLFLLGMSLGADAELISQISILGMQAFFISTLSVLGCLVAAWILSRYFFCLPEECSGAVEEKTEVSSLSDRLKAIRGSLLVLFFFFLGVFSGYLHLLPQALIESDASLWVLYTLLFCAGMGVGFDLKALAIIRELKGKIILVPLGVFLGTMLGSSLAWLILSGMKYNEALAVGGGFGYYSLATVIITKMGSPALGSVALLSNMIHEIITLTLSPVLAKVFGRLAPVMAGGAAAMDTCLPVIAQASGERYAIIAVFSGMCLTLFVPVLVPLLMEL